MNQVMPTPDPEGHAEVTADITADMLIGALPDKRLRRYVTDDLVKVINSEPEDELRRVFRDNILSYTTVLLKGQYSLAAYVNAVKYVSLKIMGDKSSVAYAKVFPDRYAALLAKGRSPSQVASYADNYQKNALVVAIMEQTLVPTHILNASIYQEAINTQAELMRTAKSEMVRQKAAESLITNLKAPEAAKVEIDINYNNDMIEDLRATTRALASQQMRMIMGGQATADDVAKSEILAKKTEAVTTEYEDITDERG